MRTFWLLALLNVLWLSGCYHRQDAQPIIKPPMLLDKGTDFHRAKTLPLIPYKQSGHTYYPAYPARKVMVTQASWYGTSFHGRKTASGETFDVYKYSAAHKTLPIPSFAKVVNLENGRTLIVRVNDRGPFIEGRGLDLSWAAARKLGLIDKGVAPVKIYWLGTEPPGILQRLFG